MGEARRVAVPIGRGDRAEASRPLVSDDPAAEAAIRRVEVDKGDHTTTGRGVADCQERPEDAPLLAVEALHHVLPVPLAHDGPARVGSEGEGVAPVHDSGQDAPEGGRDRSSTVGSDVGWHAHWLECRRRLCETHQVDETRPVAGRAEEADRVTVGGPLELTDLDSHPDRTEPGRLPGEPDPPRWAGSSGPDDQRSLGWEHVGDVARAADGGLSHAWTAQGFGRAGEGGFQEVAIAGPHDEPLAACVEADDHRLAQRPPRPGPDTRPDRHRVFGVRPEAARRRERGAPTGCADEPLGPWRDREGGLYGGLIDWAAEGDRKLGLDRDLGGAGARVRVDDCKRPGLPEQDNACSRPGQAQKRDAGQYLEAADGLHRVGLGCGLNRGTVARDGPWA